MMNTSVAEAVRVARPGRASEHRFYLGVGVLVLVVSLAAFGPSILAPSSRNVPLPMTALVAAHGLISLAWLFLFLAQTTLVATGRTATHRRLGMIGIVLALAFVIAGVFASVEEARRGFDLSGDLVPAGTVVDPSFVLAPINAFGLFAVMVGAGLRYRNRPDVHKRLMALTLLGMAGAPVAHLMGHYPVLRAGGGAFGLISALLLLSLSAVHDRLAYGRIHPTSLWGGIGGFAWLFAFFTFVAPSPAWRASSAYG
jgi:hypothetical protein